MSDSEKPKSWRERRQLIKHKWAVPFVYIEWKCEQLSKLLEQWAFLDILGQVGRLSVLVAVFFYIKGCPERQRQAVDQRTAKHLQAWQVINTAYGKPGNGGRVKALHDLHKDGISLLGVDISKAFLPGLNLTGADLRNANLAGAALWGANLAGANLSDANLSAADLTAADLSGANLSDANLSGAELTRTDLTEANLGRANLAGAALWGANLAGAYLTSADLAGTHLYNANFAGADLASADLSEANSSERPVRRGASLLEQALSGYWSPSAIFQERFSANFRNVRLNAANLHGSRLPYANLTGADLSAADLDGADLYGACLRSTNLAYIESWQQIKSIRHALIFDLKNPPDKFLEWATKGGAVIVKDEDEWKKLIAERRQEQTQPK